MRYLFLSLFFLVGTLFAKEVRVEFSFEDTQKYKIEFSTTDDGRFQVQGKSYADVMGVLKNPNNLEGFKKAFKSFSQLDRHERFLLKMEGHLTARNTKNPKLYKSINLDYSEEVPLVEFVGFFLGFQEAKTDSKKTIPYLDNMFKLYNEFELNKFELSMIALPTKDTIAKVFKIKLEGKIKGQEMLYEMIPGYAKPKEKKQDNKTQFYKDINRR